MSGTVHAVFKWFADSFIWNGEAWNQGSTAMQPEVFCDHYRKFFCDHYRICEFELWSHSLGTLTAQL